MKLNIFAKLFLSIVLGFAIVLLSMMAWVQWSFRSGFDRYLEQLDERRVAALLPALAEIYRRDGSWDSLEGNRRAWDRMAGATASDGTLTPEPGVPPWDERGDRPQFPDFPPPPDHDHGPSPDFGPHEHPPFEHGHHGGPPRDAMPFAVRLRLYDGEGRHIVGPPPPPGDFREKRTAIMVNGQIAGTVAVIRPSLQFIAGLEQTFIDQQARANYLVSALALVLSMLLAWLLARQFLKPVRAIADGAAMLRTGHYDVTVPVASGDELGALAADFNQLARTLKENEAARRQWVADISHELRTPIAVLRGEIEALQDGVREVSPQRLASLHGETLRLGKLVEDLYQLSITDLGALSYRMEPLDIADLVESVVDSFQSRFTSHALELRYRPPDDGCLPLVADRRRLEQLLGNLLENSARYTEAPGFCEVCLSCMADCAIIDINDTQPGVPDAALTHLFDRLYRVDESRGRESGGAGLGLAIGINIVAAHGGRMRASHSPFGGLGIVIELPLNPGRKPLP